MSTGGGGGNPVRGLDYGASAAQQNVDLSDDIDPKGAAAGYVPEEHEHKSLLGTIKDALRPGDSKRHEQQSPRHAGDLTHDGRHGGIEETMMRGHRDYDESMEGPGSHIDGMRTDGGNSSGGSGGGGVLESMMPGRKDRSSKGRGSGSGGGGGGGGTSTFDATGAVGHQFTSEGAVGGTAQKVGGPFSKEGAVGRQFTDKGSVGGTVQDTLGHGNATRKGV
ncbi:hypothetical protein Hte_011667 [Hypoxylon texense]